MSRRSFTIGASLAAALLVPVSGSAQEPPASPTTAASPSPSGSPAADIVFYPLPTSITDIASDIPTVSVDSTSTEALEIGQAIDFELGHCGLWSPIDLDGSLWQADGGVTPTGAPIVERDDAVLAELINATPGVFIIVADDVAHWTSVTGTFLSFARAPGALDYPMCM